MPKYSLETLSPISFTIPLTSSIVIDFENNEHSNGYYIVIESLLKKQKMSTLFVHVQQCMSEADLNQYCWLYT
jgi:hypothetical protein